MRSTTVSDHVLFLKKTLDDCTRRKKGGEKS